MTNTSIRLTYSVKGRFLEVLSAERLEMVAFAGDDLKDPGKALGSWVEVRGEDGTVLYRQVLSDFWRPGFEVFSPMDAPEAPVALVAAAADDMPALMVVVVPDLAGATQVTVVHSVSVEDGKTVKQFDVVSTEVAAIEGPTG